MWNHIVENWRTSLAGMLLAVATICGVLSQRGVTLGNAGTGTVVALIAAAATALLGLMARDPAPGAAANGDTRRKLGAWLLISLLLAGTMPVMAASGCTGSQAINEINVVLNEADSVLAVADPGAAWLAPLKNAIVALQGAETSWQNGGAVAKIDDALNTLTVVLAAIPLTAVYSPLIDVLVAAIEAVLAVLPVSTMQTRVALIQNPHAGRYTLVNRWYRTPAGNLKANWNSVAKAHGLAQMVLK